MKILVAVKRVIDYNVQVRVKEDGTGVVTDNVKMSSNPPDDNAIEEAVKIKEAGKATEIIAIISVALPASLIFTASSIALSSGGLLDIFTLSVTTPVPSSLTLT